jgi:hypothetical protein
MEARLEAGTGVVAVAPGTVWAVVDGAPPAPHELQALASTANANGRSLPTAPPVERRSICVPSVPITRDSTPFPGWTRVYPIDADKTANATRASVRSHFRGVLGDGASL